MACVLRRGMASTPMAPANARCGGPPGQQHLQPLVGGPCGSSGECANAGSGALGFEEPQTGAHAVWRPEPYGAWQVARRTLPNPAVDVGGQHRMEPSMLLPAGAARSISQGDALPPLDGIRPTTFAPCESPLGRIGFVLKLDSLYIYIGGVSPPPPPSIINQCFPPPKACGPPTRAGRGECDHSEIAPTLWATPRCRCPSPLCCDRKIWKVMKHSTRHAKLLLEGLVWC